MSVPLALIRNLDQDEHAAAGHPERPQRVLAILDYIQSQPDLAALPWLEEPALDESLPLLVHSEQHVHAVQDMSADGGGWFDPDTLWMTATTSCSQTLRPSAAIMRYSRSYSRRRSEASRQKPRTRARSSGWMC